VRTEGDAVGLGGISSYEYESLIYLCLDILELFYSYSIIEKSIAFRYRYLHSFVVRNKVRRELCVDYIFNELRRLYSMSKKNIDSLGYGYGYGSRRIYFENYLADVSFMSFPLHNLSDNCITICNKIAAILFYKEFIILKILLKKFDYTIVETISKYYVDNDKYIDFAKILRWGMGVENGAFVCG
jgi:hypothetical protein